MPKGFLVTALLEKDAFIKELVSAATKKGKKALNAIEMAGEYAVDKGLKYAPGITERVVTPLARANDYLGSALIGAKKGRGIMGRLKGAKKEVIRWHKMSKENG